MLLTLTLITVALVVLALAGYLIAIAWAAARHAPERGGHRRRPRGGARSYRALAREAHHHQRRAGRAARRPRGSRPPSGRAATVFRLP